MLCARLGHQRDANTRAGSGDLHHQAIRTHRRLDAWGMGFRATLPGASPARRAPSSDQGSAATFHARSVPSSRTRSLPEPTSTQRNAGEPRHHQIALHLGAPCARPVRFAASQVNQGFT